MRSPDQSSQQQFKIKLASGRVLGPLNLERVRLLILKNQIQGSEFAREYPHGQWKEIHQIPSLAELLIQNIQGKLGNKDSSSDSTSSSIDQSSQSPGTPDFNSALHNPLLPAALPGATQVLTTGGLVPLPELDLSDALEFSKVQPSQAFQLGNEIKEKDNEEVATLVSDPSDLKADSKADPEEEEKTIVGDNSDQSNSITLEDQANLESLPVGSDSNVILEGWGAHRKISEDNTILFQGSPQDLLDPQKKGKNQKRGAFRNILVAVAMLVCFYELMFDDPVPEVPIKAPPIRPSLPAYIEGKSDPDKSVQIYNTALKEYVADTVVGYKQAAQKFRAAASVDISNVKALAMLASSYINLIDSSNKDENYFSVLSKLIDMSRAKAVDIPETVIADVEFYLIANKVDAAQSRITEYTKTHSNIGLEMFYYLALSYYTRGDSVSAARFMGQFPDNKVYSPKIFYLRGQIAEKLQDDESAMREYKKAIQLSKTHAKSHLRIAVLLNKKGFLKESGTYLDFLVNHSNLLAPKELASAFYLHAQLAELYKKWDIAIGELERAVILDPDNHDYLLELYTLKAKTKESIKKFQKEARMFYFLSEGERLIKEGRYEDALVSLLKAREENDSSPIPLVKIGDMFSNLNEVENAKLNYKLASQRAPNDIKVWSKYIKVLIQSYEWEEATQVMDKFRQMSIRPSSIDKAAADMYQRQGSFTEAQTYYRKSMSRESIDPEVYIAYGKSLMSTKNYKDAPFFFALGLRYDPGNIDAITNTAKCIAETESIDRAITMLQDQLNLGTTARAEFLAAIAELQIQKGDWQQASQSVQQAMTANPAYAYPWKLQAQIYMSEEGTKKDALEKALSAYKSYSDRNPSDPSGYLERYLIFSKKAAFEQASLELNKIYEIYPRYPNVHFFRGRLYSIQGNHKAAAEEYEEELKNNPLSTRSLIAFGLELMEIGQIEKALEKFTKAMELSPKSADAKQQAGWANYHLKHFQAAIALLKNAIALDKANPVLSKRLGIVYQAMGDTASACEAFRRYLEMEPDAPDKAEFQACLR